MRRAVLLAAAAVALVGPAALAFFSGGYFDGPRLVATALAWVLVLVAALAAPVPLPTSWPGRGAVAGMAMIAVWSAVSLLWAPLSDPAMATVIRALLYLGVLLAAAALLRERVAWLALEPALALGAVVVIGYGVVGRLLPGVLTLAQSDKAGARLEQPLTYWNAEGLLAAMGFVLCARLAGTAARPAWMRALAAAACPLLALGLYLSYSRGAIAAAVVGVALLLAAAPTTAQLRAAAVGVGAGLAAGLAGAVFPAVASLDGDLGDREAQGAVVLAILVAVAFAAAFVQRLICRREEDGRFTDVRLRGAERLPAVAGAVVVLCLAGLIAGGLAERGDGDELSSRQGASRLTTVESRRYDYWDVALRAVGDDPLRGLGAAGFRVEWLRERPVAESALEVHSLPLEMAVELGLPGLLGFALLVASVAVAGARALRRDPILAPGAAAAATVWLLHATIDWDWQLPAVTIPALAMAGGLIAASEAADPEGSAA